MKYIDTHSHFNLSQFDADREEAIARMEEHETGTFCVGIDFNSSKAAIELAQKSNNIWAIVGQHPTEWEREFDVPGFTELAKLPRVVGIGECGLDYFREKDRNAKATQEKNFRTQIELAIKTKLPLMLHIRPQQGTMDAYVDALSLLKEYKAKHPDLTGTSHFFAGNSQIAQGFLDLGFYISFSGVITFVKEYGQLVNFVPVDRILTETDAPFAAPVPYRGQRCEPMYVQEVVKKIAEIKKIPFEDVRKQLLQNAEDLFKI